MSQTDSKWEEAAKEDLGNVVHVWNKIGEELNPVLIEYIRKVEKQAEERVIREIDEGMGNCAEDNARYLKDYAKSKGITL